MIVVCVASSEGDEVKTEEKPEEVKVIVEISKEIKDIDKTPAVAEEAEEVEAEESVETAVPVVESKIDDRSALSFEEELKNLQADKDRANKQLEEEKKKVEAILKSQLEKVQKEKDLTEGPLTETVPAEDRFVRPVFKAPDDNISHEKVNSFYDAIDGEMNEIKSIIAGWDNGGFKKTDLLKIGKFLGLISKNSLFSSLGRGKQIFVQVIRYIETMETNTTELKPELIAQNTKDMLKYIEKENILSNSRTILEQINELGIKNHQIQSQISKNKPGKRSQMDSLRERIAKSNVIKNEKILNNMAKTNRR